MQGTQRARIEIWHKDRKTGVESLATFPVYSITPVSAETLDHIRTDCTAKLGNVIVILSRIVPIPQSSFLGESHAHVDPSTN